MKTPSSTVLTSLIPGSFHCASGGCVPSRLHCNGVDDCGDFSDEFNCPTPKAELSCLRHEQGESGHIQTPNWPATYPPNAHCIWLIEGPVGTRIELEFTPEQFELEAQQDWVIVEDGGPSPNASTVLAQLTGSTMHKRQAVWTSSGNWMRVLFRSDPTMQAKGFQANWRAIPFKCGGRLTAQAFTQMIQSPDYPQRAPPGGVECVWRVEAPQGQLISLMVEEIALPERSYLTVHDGAHPSKPILVRLEGGASQR